MTLERLGSSNGVRVRKSRDMDQVRSGRSLNVHRIIICTCLIRITSAKPVFEFPFRLKNEAFSVSNETHVTSLSSNIDLSLIERFLRIRIVYDGSAALAVRWQLDLVSKWQSCRHSQQFSVHYSFTTMCEYKIKIVSFTHYWFTHQFLSVLKTSLKSTFKSFGRRPRVLLAVVVEKGVQRKVADVVEKKLGSWSTSSIKDYQELYDLCSLLHGLDKLILYATTGQSSTRQIKLRSVYIAWLLLTQTNFLVKSKWMLAGLSIIEIIILTMVRPASNLWLPCVRG